MTRSLHLLTRLTACLGLAFAVSARADEPTESLPLTMEAQISAVNAPMGKGGLALLYDPHRWFSVGIGLGKDTNRTRYGLFSRARLFRSGPFGVGVALNLSRGQYEERRVVQSGDMEWIEWYWDMATRLDTGISADLRGKHLALRIEGGAAFLLDSPTCQFHNARQPYSGNCDSPEIPAAYHLSPEPGRISAYLMLSLSYRPPGLGAPNANAGRSHEDSATSLDYRPGQDEPSGNRAPGWSWILSFLAAEGGGIPAGLALVGLAYLLPQSKGTVSGESYFNPLPILGFLLVAPAFPLGQAAGARLYGRSTDQSDGSFGAAVLGSMLGTAVSAGVMVALARYTSLGKGSNGRLITAACIMFPILPALGATFGYAISSSTPAPQTALVQYDSETGVHLGLPMVSLSKSELATTVDVPVLAGRY